MTGNKQGAVSALPAAVGRREHPQRGAGRRVGGRDHPGLGRAHDGLNDALAERRLGEAGAGQHPVHTGGGHTAR